jgi:hypothetical protein
MRCGQWKKIKASALNLMTFLIGILLGAVLSGWSAQAGTVSPDFAVSEVQFANEVSVETRFDFDFKITSDEKNGEVRLFGFFESGGHGQSSIDLDPVVLRLKPFTDGHLWIGRTNPAGEAFQISQLDHASAVGANWSQNQRNALEPSVSGWIGAGFRQRVPRSPISVSMAFSPIFLPSFGPSLELSPSEDAHGSRFAKLPPAEVLMPSGALLPLRYDLQTGELAEVLQQPQWYQSVGYEDRWIQAHLFGWSAPKPDPVIDHSEKLRILRERDVDVLVTAKPSFPREHFWGARVASDALPLSPELELAWEANSRQTTVSAALEPSTLMNLGFMWRLGGLSRFGDPNTSYAQSLLWTEASGRIYKALSGELRYEQHLLHAREGGWVKPTLHYQANATFGLFAFASVIAGEDSSYFGHWRALDSIAVGARARW